MAEGYSGPKPSLYGNARAARVKPKQEDQAPKTKEQKKFYHFNLKLPEECRAYLQEMAWRNRTTITDYLADMVLADMEAHPEWKDSLDELSNL